MLVNELKDSNKTLVIHCAKLIKKWKTSAATPVLIRLTERDENPYVVRSSIDALVKMVPLEILLSAREILTKRKSFTHLYGFINKHLAELDQQFLYLQNTANS